MNTNKENIDEELITTYRAGDKSAFTLLVKRWHLKFCKKAYWLVKDADLSKDIAQDSWRVILNKLSTLEKPSSFKSWAYRIVYSKSMDVLREQSRKCSKESELQQSQDNLITEDMPDNTVVKEKLLKAIQSLPHHQQLVIRMFYTEEYSLKEISEIMNSSVGTTKSRLFHAREKLKLIVRDKSNKQ